MESEQMQSAEDQLQAAPPRCQGSCGMGGGAACRGQVRRVRVVCRKTGFDWGRFNYCENAVAVNEGMGFRQWFEEDEDAH